tara:strand:+ start:1894 stop:2724 length:831 start_codon:yes stop_codon:yes gene_type:complete
MVAHFFDIDTFVKLEQKVWIIDKSKPNSPVLKLSKSDYNILKKGLFLNQNLKLRIGGEYFYFSEEMLDSIKLGCKKIKANVSDLTFSFTEFKNIESLNYKLDLSSIKHLFRTNDIVYIVCSKMKNPFYEKIVEELNQKLRSNGLKPRDFYFLIEDSTKVLDDDKLIYKKMKLFLQHLVGYKTDNNTFIDEKLTDVDDVYYYGDNKTDISRMESFNKLFRKLLSNTDEYLKDIILSDIKERKKTLTTHFVSSNKMNLFDTKSYDLSYNNRLKRFKDF